MTPRSERVPLSVWLERAPVYEAYTYSYPHKTSYRAFEEPLSLRSLWQDEDRSSLFLYLHVPFCEMRCGFCNLFTRAHTEGDLTERYVRAVERQAHAVREAVGPASFARVAFGGGTPTFLDVEQLERLYDVAENVFGASIAELPTSLETSPETASEEHLRAALDRGVDRISIGIQSFFDDELAALGRPLRGRVGVEALDRIRKANPKVLNIDLIYGIAGQTEERWRDSLEQALRWTPEELYLYPLYVRPLTGLGRQGREWEDQRLARYREARSFLTDAGYEQISTRLFRRADTPDAAGPEYTCQEDGMIGLGCGARSYTREVHYSDDWAVSATQVKQILADWVERGDEEFTVARYGATLDDHEQRARYVLKSVLQRSGLDANAYEKRFGTNVRDEWPELDILVRDGFLDESYRPTELGLERGDQIGPWLYSKEVRAAMQAFELR